MRNIKLSLVFLLLFLAVIGLFLGEMKNSNIERQALIKAKVIETDDSDVIQSSIARIGMQELTVKILEDKHQGEQVVAYNTLQGKPSLDNYYNVGDTILVALQEQDNKLVNANAVDMYRNSWEIILFVLFVLLLIIYAKSIGIKAIFSFIASLYIIWKFLIPGLLAGYNPMLFSTLILLILSAIILFSIAGFTKKGLASFIGTVVGLMAASGIAVIFGNKMSLQGMTVPYAETLLFSGNIGLDMKHIFYAAIVIGASGAAMDIAMDISASMEEIKIKKPDIELWELVRSGFNVGRAVIGTMTTTLLLAYSGGYLTLMMLFLSQNTSYTRMLNYKVVAAELLRIVTGSIGLVLVAPITAIVAGWIYTVELRDIKVKKMISDFSKNYKVK
ncbi:YibE/F family protein [Iocasia frigidifontis]|uniref:YibE/F family protein n=1 Tax=Iocasia fonsfrigidae TaxID=2682810 RepID=A0A8A7KC90_9FIRM|nr:YibE/F family protein [Iocasia fonsfrigidae]QTL99473.1 YibE/F family protein [Iocasia fonsfrigidae]